MVFIKKTFEYLFVLEKGKRFLLLFLLSLPVGLTLAAFVPNYSYMDWLLNYTVGNFNYWNAWTFGRGGGGFILTLLIFIPVAIMFCAVQTTVISRSLRVGVFKMTRFSAEVNENFFSTVYALAVYLGIYIIYKAITSLLLMLWQVIPSVPVSLILSLISIVTLMTLTVVVMSFTAVFLPIMIFEGLKPLDAILISVQKSGKRIKELFPALGIPAAVQFIVGILFGLLPSKFLAVLLSGVVYSLFITYLIALTMIIYYETEQIKREDYPKSYYFRRKR